MARTREREASRERDRPPRMTGMGLVQMALLGGAVAVVFALFGVFMAGSRKDPTGSHVGDSLGAALCALLTAPEPGWWTKDHDTWTDLTRFAKEIYGDGFKWPKVDKATGDKILREQHQQRTRNKERLVQVERALGVVGGGAFQGMMIRSPDAKKLGNHTIGARIQPEQVRTARQVGDVNVGYATASNPLGGSFYARVFHRPYRDPKTSKRVGDTYVILKESALVAKGGAGMWLFLTPLLVAAGVGLFLFSASKTSEGMKTLARDLDTIGRGRLDLRVTTRGTGELGFLQKTADRMAKNLQLIQTTGSGDLDEALEKELDLANQIHQGLLPSDPPRVPGYELETLFKVGRDIGGDYHDYIELDPKRIAIILADCSESLRGVPAAMVMAMTRAYLRAAIDPATGPADWLKRVNRQLARDLKSGMAVTAMIVVANTESHEAVAVSAGHRPLVLWRQGKTASINPNGIALGLDVGPVFEKTMEEKRFSFQRNDRIVLYTDGVLSAENETGEVYGEKQLLEAIRRQGAMNSAAFVNFIASGVDKFLQGAEQGDDITVCTLKRMK